MRSFGFNEDHKESNLLEEHKNYGNYFQKKKQNLIDNFKVFKEMHEEFIFPSQLQRVNNYRQYSEELPIYAKKIEFIRAIKRKRVVIFKSNPGSGKSTQLPQYLLDCVKGRILVTEPRVIAVEGVARRVIEVHTLDLRRCRVWMKAKGKNCRRSLATSEAQTITSTRRT
jgi:HrpA-like RNA helicase